jgi:hypothetical protein
MVDELRWSPTTSSTASSSPYLKVVDRYGEWLVSAYLCPSGERLMLLHDVKSEDAIKQFLFEASEYLMKASSISIPVFTLVDYFEFLLQPTGEAGKRPL